jgi:hypothetical protein
MVRRGCRATRSGELLTDLALRILEDEPLSSLSRLLPELQKDAHSIEGGDQIQLVQLDADGSDSVIHVMALESRLSTSDGTSPSSSPRSIKQRDHRPGPIPRSRPSGTFFRYEERDGKLYPEGAGISAVHASGRVRPRHPERSAPGSGPTGMTRTTCRPGRGVIVLRCFGETTAARTEHGEVVGSCLRRCNFPGGDYLYLRSGPAM